MNRDKIENSKDWKQEKDLLTEFMGGGNSAGKQLVDLNAQASPAVLSGVLGCNVQQIYQFRQDGKLPPNSDASFRECIKWYATFYKTKSISKASSMGEAALVQKIQLDRAKTEQTWLNIKRDRGELIDVSVLAEQFEAHFIHMRMQLCAIARRKPEMQEDIDKVLAEWSKLGKDIMRKSETELDDFIQARMEDEIQVEKPEEDLIPDNLRITGDE